MVAHNYLSVPIPNQDGINPDNPTYQFPKTNLDLKIESDISTGGNILGNGPFITPANRDEVLNPD
jgi:hypothetical protein